MGRTGKAKHASHQVEIGRNVRGHRVAAKAARYLLARRPVEEREHHGIQREDRMKLTRGGRR